MSSARDWTMYESVHLALPRWQFVILCNIDLALCLSLKDITKWENDQSAGYWKSEARMRLALLRAWSTFAYSSSLANAWRPFMFPAISGWCIGRHAQLPWEQPR
jgi:hypothetical protein